MKVLCFVALSRQRGTRLPALRSLLDSQSSTPEALQETRTSINTVRYGVGTLSTAH